MRHYQEKTFNLGAVAGFSEKQISEHLKLYAGYVKNTNKIAADIARPGWNDVNSVAVFELRRRFGFEFNVMRLHELYFEALGASASAEGFGRTPPEPLATERGQGGSALAQALTEQFGSVDAWASDFKKEGMMRGIGWVLLCHDSHTGNLFNAWVTDHEIGHLAGLPILLAMDVWEHAYALDFLPTGRKEYIEVFFKNLRWEVVESRFR